MVITIKSKEVELKYSFHSLKYMKDFSLKELEDIEDKPMLLASALETLLMGAVNHRRTEQFTLGNVQDFLEQYIDEEENDMVELLQNLMKLLEESGFFKSLRKRANVTE